MHGAILGRYLQLGGSGGALGLPVADEYAVPDAGRSDFKRDFLRWNAGTGGVTLIAG